MKEQFKLAVKLGEFEFSAEGPEGIVRDQYKAWLTLVEQLARTGRHTAPRGMRIGAAAEADSLTGASPTGGSTGAPSNDLLKRVFLVDPKAGTVSLRVLPQGPNREGDSLILLIYGFAHYFSETAVLGTKLMKAARASGLQVGRVDRAIGPHSDKVTVAGLRKGRKYGLNNPGAAYAHRALSEILS